MIIAIFILFLFVLIGLLSYFGEKMAEKERKIYEDRLRERYVSRKEKK